MKLRLDILLFAGLLIFMSGCAGNQMNETVVKGGGPGMPVPASEARRVELQDRLLKMTAMMPTQHYTDYKVGPEDAIQVTFLGPGNTSGGAAPTMALAAGAGAGQINTAPGQMNNVPGQLSGIFRVDGRGDIRLMLVGNVRVAGLTPVDIAEKLTGLYKNGGYLVDPEITVSVAEYRHAKVAVSGAVATPNYYPLIGPRSLLEVLGMAGGLATGAGDTVNIIRPRPAAPGATADNGLNAKTISIDLNRLLLQGDTSLNITIENGDVVFVPFAQSAYVIGSVTKPGNVLLQHDMTLTRAISMCEGKNIQLASNYVTVLRVENDGSREVIPVDIAKVLKGDQPDVLLKPNDVVYVHESKLRRFLFDFKNMLPGSMGLSAGSTL